VGVISQSWRFWKKTHTQKSKPHGRPLTGGIKIPQTHFFRLHFFAPLCSLAPLWAFYFPLGGPGIRAWPHDHSTWIAVASLADRTHHHMQHLAPARTPTTELNCSC
jgi:hypothetical protein